MRLDGLPLETMESCRWVLEETSRKMESGQSAGAVLLDGAEKLAWLLTDRFGYRHDLGMESPVVVGAFSAWRQLRLAFIGVGGEKEEASQDSKKTEERVQDKLKTGQSGEGHARNKSDDRR